MATTKSARKATRVIARRTEVNKARRSALRSSVRMVEEAIAGGDRKAATAALKAAEPVIMRSAQLGVVHKRNASRKISRLSRRITKLFVKLKFADFTRTTIERAGLEPTLQAFRTLLAEAFARTGKKVRLIGVGVRFADNPTEELQIPLFSDAAN